MQNPPFKLLLLSASCSLILSACGGVSTSNTSTSLSEAPVTAVSTPVSVVGRITAFGSVYVNGVKYEVNNASLKNERPDGTKNLSESDLKIGMVVNINGNRTGTTGTATSVSYDELVEAPVTNVSINSTGIGSFVAGGKQVNISSTTMFYGDTSRTSIASIVAGDWVEVSGYVGSDGSVDATLVSYETRDSHGNQAEFEGIISNYNAATQHFTLNGIDVDFSNAILSSTTVSLANGVAVEVYGTLDTTLTKLAATHLKLEHSSSDLDSDHSENDESYHSEGSESELQGIVSGATSGQFQLAGVTVLYNAMTRLSGLLSTQIQDGLFLEEVEGHFNGQGQLIADKIKVESHSINGVSDDRYSTNELKVSSIITAIDTANSTLTIMGYPVAITASTLLKDDDRDEYYFNINSLSVGDFAEALLIKNTDNSYSLKKLERERMDFGSTLKGVVNQVNADASVVVGATTIILPSGRTAVVDMKIKVEGTFDLSSQTLTATDFENDD